MQAAPLIKMIKTIPGGDRLYIIISPSADPITLKTFHKQKNSKDPQYKFRMKAVLGLLSTCIIYFTMQSHLFSSLCFS